MLTQELKKGKNIMVIILLVILLIMPLGNYFYHRSLYYIIVVFIFIPLTFYRIMRHDALEKKFYFKWEKKRKKGRLANMLNEGFKFISLMVVIVLGNQFIVNGRTPSFIFSKLSMNASIRLMLGFVFFGSVGGIVAWYENEKRYKKIYLNTEDEEIIEKPPTEWKHTK